MQRERAHHDESRRPDEPRWSVKNVLTSQRRPEKSGLQTPGESFVFFFSPPPSFNWRSFSLCIGVGQGDSDLSFDLSSALI